MASPNQKYSTISVARMPAMLSIGPQDAPLTQPDAPSHRGQHGHAGQQRPLATDPARNSTARRLVNSSSSPKSNFLFVEFLDAGVRPRGLTPVLLRYRNLHHYHQHADEQRHADQRRR